MVLRHADDVNRLVFTSAIENSSRVADVGTNNFLFVYQDYDTCRTAQLGVDVNVLLDHVVQADAQVGQCSFIVYVLVVLCLLDLEYVFLY